MILDRGARLGPYEILEPLGAGGMGEVYKARDTRLNRSVAIKISQAKFSERFDREARAIAALNHPHICALYDVGPDYLVMELVEGSTLADRIAAGRIEPTEALAMARQIAEALEAAHEKGIVHRDLKPANVKITPDGVVKVLDFGLAKSEAESAAAADGTNSPTVTISPTRAGTILGTAAYMSPEQVRGAAVDKRADIWAFGVVLYEMLSGKRLFTGESVSDILAGVLRAEPDWSALPKETPVAVRRLLRRCLERDRKKRLRDIGDARLELDQPEEAPPAVTPVRRGPLFRWTVAIAVAVALVLVLRSRVWPEAGQPGRPVSRWTAILPGAGLSDVAISRDGRYLVYAGPTAAAESLMLRTMDRLDAKPLAGTAGAVGPMFSPDGQWITFYEGERLAKVAVTGGPPITICRAPGQRGRTWGDDDTIVFGTIDGGLMRVPAAGGVPQPLTTLDRRKGETAHQWPFFLTGAQSIVFTILTGGASDASQIAVLDVARRTYHTVVNGGSNARYAPSGHLIFGRLGRLFAAPFDAKRLVVKGPEVPVIQDLAMGGLNTLGTARFSFSDSGLLVYLGGAQQLADRTLEWVDRQGKRQASKLPPRLYSDISLSPDGRQVAASIGSNLGTLGGADIWSGDLERGALNRLTSEGWSFSPVWTPDGRRITFGSYSMGRQFLKEVTADGSGRPEVLLEGVTQLTPLSWAPADLLLFLARDSGLMRISLLQAHASGAVAKPRRLLEPGFGEGHGDAQVSPDRRWIAYASSESGRFEIYVRPYPSLGRKVLISTQGGESPRWGKNGLELFYCDPVKSQLMAVEVQTTREFRAGQPRPLFTLHSTIAGNSGLSKGWDVSPDGKRFLVINAPEGPVTGLRLQAVVNWFEELRRTAPADK